MEGSCIPEEKNQQTREQTKKLYRFLVPGISKNSLLQCAWVTKHSFSVTVYPLLFSKRFLEFYGKGVLAQSFFRVELSRFLLIREWNFLRWRTGTRKQTQSDVVTPSTKSWPAVRIPILRLFNCGLVLANVAPFFHVLNGCISTFVSTTIVKWADSRIAERIAGGWASRPAILAQVGRLKIAILPDKSVRLLMYWLEE